MPTNLGGRVIPESVDCTSSRKGRAITSDLSKTPCPGLVVILSEGPIGTCELSQNVRGMRLFFTSWRKLSSRYPQTTTSIRMQKKTRSALKMACVAFGHVTVILNALCGRNSHDAFVGPMFLLVIELGVSRRLP